MPCAIAASVRTLHGATTIPIVRNDPLEIDGALIGQRVVTVASACTCSGV